MTIPAIADPSELVDWFITSLHEPDADDLFLACCRVGNNDAPSLVVELFLEGLLTAEAARPCLGFVWSKADNPDALLPHETWRELFEYTGYTADGELCDRPRTPLTLWRGCVSERRLDWSWTDNREVAERQYCPRRVGSLYKATVAPWRLLGRTTERGRHEYVVDTDGLRVECASGDAAIAEWRPALGAVVA